MKNMLHSLRLPALLVAALSPLFAWLAMNLGPELCNDVRTVTDYELARNALNRETARAVDLDSKRAIMRARAEGKSRICHDLIDGRCTLAAAARRLAELPAPPEDLGVVLGSSDEGATEHERLCRHAIDWTCEMLRDDPVAAGAMRRRLEAELESCGQGPSS